MKIAVIGCGRWGSFIAWYLDKIGNEVTLYGRETSEKMKNFLENRKNNFLELPKSISLTTNINDVFDKDLIIISVGTQGLRDLLNENRVLFKETNIPIILCMKGIEIKTGFTPTKIVKDILGENYSCGAWIGPGHVQDFTNGIPNCMVIDSDDRELVKKLVDSFSSNLIRFYYGTNLLGNEIGAASKNVIGIAAGMLDGFNLSSLKGALMPRGTREIARLIEKMGRDKSCAYVLWHLGDYVATVFSEFSNNRKFGEKFVKGESFEKLAEGYFTTKALMDLSEKYDVELPITNAVYEIIYNKKDPKEILDNLFKRSIKMEF